MSTGPTLDDKDGRQPRVEDTKLEPEGQNEHDDAPAYLYVKPVQSPHKDEGGSDDSVTRPLKLVPDGVVYANVACKLL